MEKEPLLPVVCAQSDSNDNDKDADDDDLLLEEEEVDDDGFWNPVACFHSD